jgi:hypothetical protein
LNRTFSRELEKICSKTAEKLLGLTSNHLP